MPKKPFSSDKRPPKVQKDTKQLSSSSQNYRLLGYVFFAVLAVYYVILAFDPIRFTTQDIGRHIKNGEVVIQHLGNLSAIKGFLSTNFYSYTYPDFPFINHHWLSGVIFYVVKEFVGFKGLSLFYFFLCLASIFLFFRIAEREGGPFIAFAAALAAMPIIAARREIRPEVFGYIFFALFVWIITSWEQRRISRRWLWLLPVIMVVWVNCHISFIFGPIFMLLVLFEKVFTRRWRAEEGKSNTGMHEGYASSSAQFRALSIESAFVIVAACINPFGIRGLLFPFLIFQNYGLTVIENQSVQFLIKRGVVHADFLAFKLFIAFLAVCFIALIITNRKRISLRWLFLSCILGSMAFLAIRHFTLFGLVGIVALAHAISALQKEKSMFLSRRFLVFVCLILSLVWMTYYHRYLFAQMKDIRFGMRPEQNSAAEFIKKNRIHGPFFNNYDIGSYLIYHCFPDERVFVDNRPEAYPASFFHDEYIPMQSDDAMWKQMLERYRFQAIVFQYNDMASYAQSFLARRVHDPVWAPIFARDEVIIFLLRTPQNSELIRKYEIPKEYFSAAPQR